MRQMIGKFRPIVIVLTLALAWFCTPLGWIPMSLVKLPAVTDRYAAIFFGILLVGLFILRPKIESMNWMRALLLATVIGYFLSLTSILAGGLFSQDGLERMSNSLETFGWMNFLVMESALAAGFAGCLIVPLAVACLKFQFKNKLQSR